MPRQIAALQQALDGNGLLEMKSGFDREAIAQLWAARKSLSHAVKQIAPLKVNEDVVVPVSQLADFVDFIDHTAHAHRLEAVSFGHAGNGNLHVNLMVHPDDADEMDRAHLALDAIILRALALGGTLSGEHGIGTEKRRFIAAGNRSRHARPDARDQAAVRSARPAQPRQTFSRLIVAAKALQARKASIECAASLGV